SVEGPALRLGKPHRMQSGCHVRAGHKKNMQPSMAEAFAQVLPKVVVLRQGGWVQPLSAAGAEFLTVSGLIIVELVEDDQGRTPHFLSEDGQEREDVTGSDRLLEPQVGAVLLVESDLHSSGETFQRSGLPILSIRVEVERLELAVTLEGWDEA